MAVGGAIDPRLLEELSFRFAARAAGSDRTGIASRENLADLKEAGLLGLTVSPLYGGRGAGLREAAHVIGRLAEGDPAIALILSMQYLQHASIARGGHWPVTVQGLVSRAAVEEGALLNALRVEPALGTPARGGMPDTTARRHGNAWRISGRKIFSTGSTVLRWGYVWAKTDEAEPRVGGFLVPMAAAGLRIEESWNHLGMRATESHTVVLDDVEVPSEHAVDVRLPSAWKAPDPIMATWNTIVMASLYDGIARAARRWLIGFLNERAPANLGAPLATVPRLQELVGEVDSLLLANRLMLEAAVAAEARGEPASWAEGGLIKHLVTENAIRSVEKSVAAIGNPALSRDNPMERHLRNVLCGRIHTPQGDAVLGLSGRLSLGAA